VRVRNTCKATARVDDLPLCVCVQAPQPAPTPPAPEARQQEAAWGQFHGNSPADDGVNECEVLAEPSSAPAATTAGLTEVSSYNMIIPNLVLPTKFATSSPHLHPRVCHAVLMHVMLPCILIRQLLLWHCPLPCTCGVEEACWQLPVCVADALLGLDMCGAGACCAGTCHGGKRRSAAGHSQRTCWGLPFRPWCSRWLDGAAACWRSCWERCCWWLDGAAACWRSCRRSRGCGEPPVTDYSCCGERHGRRWYLVHTGEQLDTVTNHQATLCSFDCRQQVTHTVM
jgi:hypothetical protein